jgi:hypothetical protein
MLSFVHIVKATPAESVLFSFVILKPPPPQNKIKMLSSREEGTFHHLHAKLSTIQTKGVCHTVAFAIYIIKVC